MCPQNPEQEQAQWQVQAEAPALPQLDRRARTFVKKYVELGGHRCGERAALMAGYGKISAYQGGRSAAVKACILLKRHDIQQAIREEYQAMLYRNEQLQLEAERRAERRAMVSDLVDNLKQIVRDDKPHSKAAQLMRRLQGQPVKRVPGYCVCGDTVTEGYASCENCRLRHRLYRQVERAAKRSNLSRIYLP